MDMKEEEDDGGGGNDERKKHPKKYKHIHCSAMARTCTSFSAR